MKKQVIVTLLIFTMITGWMLMGCGGGDDDKNGTGPGTPIADLIIGLWQSTQISFGGFNIPSSVISMSGKFEADNTVMVEVVQPDTTSELPGTYTTKVDSLFITFTSTDPPTGLNGQMIISGNTGIFNTYMTNKLLLNLDSTYAALFPQGVATTVTLQKQ